MASAVPTENSILVENLVLATRRCYGRRESPHGSGIDVTQIGDPDYLRLLREICTEQAAIAAGVGADGKPLSAADLRARWYLIWPRVLESDRPAIAAEAEIYRELLARK